MRQPRGLRLAFASLACTLLVCTVLVSGCTSEPGPSVQTSSSLPPVVATTSETTNAPSAPRPSTAEATPAVPAPHFVAVPPAAKAPARPRRDNGLYPDPRLTPGDVFQVSAAQVSVSGYASKVRNVPVTEKRAVYAEYHLAYPEPAGSYECDHFIPLCLGGSNSIKNLWPEPAPQFHWKDGLEVYLWHEVRNHTISLAEAQREIRTDWYAYWVKAGKPGSAADADSSAVQSAPAPISKSSTGLIVGWSVSGARYHYLSCRYFAQIKSVNRRTGTVAQARAAGKTPCRVCRPPD